MAQDVSTEVAGFETRKASEADVPRTDGAEAVDLEALLGAELAGLADPKDRWEVVSDTAKDIARMQGAEVMRRILSADKTSVNELAARFGFAPATVSKIVRGKSEAGPTLWMLLAMADIQGLDLEIKVKRRS
jgi:DNA-binding Xre family transcriptional regulator